MRSLAEVDEAGTAVVNYLTVALNVWFFNGTSNTCGELDFVADFAVFTLFPCAFLQEIFLFCIESANVVFYYLK